MENNLALSIAFNGQVKTNGQPLYNPNGVYTRGGYTATDDSQTAYFGRAVSTKSADANAFYMGIPSASYTYQGILLNEQNIRENDPAKPDYVLPGIPTTVVYFGHIWLPTWTKTATGAIDPVAGCKVIAKATTGQIEFLATGTAVPAGWVQLTATLVYVDTYLGALVFVGKYDVGANLSSNSSIQMFALPLSPYLATITAGTKAIAITVPNGSTVTALKAQFVVDENATVKIGSTAQVSGTTANDFTNPVVYRVTAQDGSYSDWTVTVTVAP